MCAHQPCYCTCLPVSVYYIIIHLCVTIFSQAFHQLLILFCVTVIRQAYVEVLTLFVMYVQVCVIHNFSSSCLIGTQFCPWVKI